MEGELKTLFHWVPMVFNLSTLICGESDPTSTRTPQGMDSRWTRNTFSLGSSSLANHDG